MRAPRTGQLTIDEAGDTGVFAARPELVGGYQPLDGRIEKANLRLCQVAVYVQKLGLRHVYLSFVVNMQKPIAANIDCSVFLAL
jgi:hypothetical protein